MATAQQGVAAAHKEVEAERDRFKKVIQELKKKLDRCNLPPAALHIRSTNYVMALAALLEAMYLTVSSVATVPA